MSRPPRRGEGRGRIREGRDDPAAPHAALGVRPPRRPRGLSQEDAHLWGAIAKLITPLRARALVREAKAAAKVAAEAPAARAPVKAVPAMPPVAAPKATIPAPPAKSPKRTVRLGAAVVVPAPAPAFVPAPAAPGLERRERQRLSRGLLAIEGRIDLHGLYQAEAHAALVGFLLRARAAGHARVLVVTGKGGEDAYATRGVLRRSVPHWLRGAELRPFVLGFEEAARHHGGAGALYVRLRRR